jgi:hypothetical protein
MAIRIKAIFHNTKNFKIVGFCPPAIGTSKPRKLKIKRN